MKKVLTLILFAVLAFVGIHAQGTIQRIALLNLQKGNIVESSRAGQIGLTDSNGNQRYAQYTEIDLVPITYTPTTTGNTQNYSEFVTTTGGDIWYIDWQGRGLRIYTAASAAAGDYDWLEIGNNQIPNSIRDSIYTDNYAAINVRLVWPQAQLLVGDSLNAANIVALGNRESRIGFYRLTGPNWSSIGQEGGSLVARLGTNTVGFEVQSSGGISPSQPAAPFRSIVRINKDSTIQLLDFKSTRNDTATVNNILYTDGQGFLKSSPIGDLKAGPVQLGEIKKQTSFSNLTGWINNGTTVTAGSGLLNFSGGVGNFTHTLDHPRTTCLEYWTMEGSFLTTSNTGLGFGLGVNSTNSNANPAFQYNTYGYFDLTAGTVNITQQNNTVIATSSALSYSIGDTIFLRVERISDTVLVTATNVNTNLKVSIKAGYSLTSGFPYIHNTGRFGVLSLGGTFSLKNIRIFSSEIKNADLMLIGDSKVAGTAVSNIKFRHAELLKCNINTVVVSAGGADNTTEVLNKTDEIIALSPRSVFLSIGSNDIRFGIPIATIRSNYDTIVARLSNAGIQVFHSTMFMDIVNQQPLINHIRATYPASTIVETFAQLSLPGNSTDGYHPNQTGHALIAKIILESYINKSGGKHPCTVVSASSSPSSEVRSWNRNGNTGTGTDTLGTIGNFPINFYTNSSKKMELTTLGYAQYSQNLQDSILANDRRILDLGSLKRYLVLNPPASSEVRSWNRNGNTGTGTDTLGTTGNFPINLYTNSIKRMELTSDGKVALGLNSFNGNQGALYTNFSATARTYTGFGTGHWINSSALPAIVLDNSAAATGKQVFSIEAQTTGRTVLEYRNNNGTGSPSGAANILVLNPSVVNGSRAAVGINTANPSSSLDVTGTVAFRAVSATIANQSGMLASVTVDNCATLQMTYTGTPDAFLVLPTPTVTTAKIFTVINSGTIDFVMNNVHLKAVNGQRSCTFYYDNSNSTWEPTTVRNWSSTNALGSNTVISSGGVTDNIVTVSLPVAGTYELRGQIQGTTPLWNDGDAQVRLGSGATSELNTVGTMKQFTDGSLTRMALTFVKRITVAAPTNIILSVNNRCESQALTILASNTNGQGTSIIAEKIN